MTMLAQSEAADGTFLVDGGWGALAIAAAVALVLLSMWSSARWLRREAKNVPAAPPASARVETLPWLAVTLIAFAAFGLADLAGSALAIFGLAGVALGAALVVLLVAATIGRRAALPLAAVSVALATGATFALAEEGRLDRSKGLLVAEPATSAEAEGPFVRGLGSVLVDMQGTRPRTGAPTRVVARADAGRVVVRLPNDRCVNVRVRAGRTGPDGDGISGPYETLVTTAKRAGLFPADEDDPPSGHERPYTSGGVVLYGIPRWSRRDGPVTAVRRSADPRAPWILVDATAGTDIVVREFPDGKGALGTEEEVEENTMPERYRRLRGTTWPSDAYVPNDAPEELVQAGSVAAARTKAQAWAGYCASRSTLRTRWVTVTGGPLTGRKVNGLGEIQGIGRR